ncbi:MAG: hypothetical protein AB1630_00740 [bacterium]
MEDRDFLEYWIRLSEKIEKSKKPSVKDEFFTLFWKEPFFELSIASFIFGIVSIRVFSMLKLYDIFEYLPKIMGLML